MRRVFIINFNTRVFVKEFSLEILIKKILVRNRNNKGYYFFLANIYQENYEPYINLILSKLIFNYIEKKCSFKVYYCM